VNKEAIEEFIKGYYCYILWGSQYENLSIYKPILYIGKLLIKISSTVFHGRMGKLEIFDNKL